MNWISFRSSRMRPPRRSWVLWQLNEYRWPTIQSFLKEFLYSEVPLSLPLDFLFVSFEWESWLLEIRMKGNVYAQCLSNTIFVCPFSLLPLVLNCPVIPIFSVSFMKFWIWIRETPNKGTTPPVTRRFCFCIINKYHAGGKLKWKIANLLPQCILTVISNVLTALMNPKDWHTLPI